MSVIYVDVLKESYKSINIYIRKKSYKCLQLSENISNSTHYFVHGILGLLIDR